MLVEYETLLNFRLRNGIPPIILKSCPERKDVIKRWIVYGVKMKDMEPL